MEELEATEERNNDDILAAVPVAQFSMPYRPAFWLVEMEGVHGMYRTLFPQMSPFSSQAKPTYSNP